MDAKPLIFDLDFEEIVALFQSWDEPAYRAEQLWKGLYRNYWNEPEQFTNFSKNLRQKLAGYFDFGHLNPVFVAYSTDGETRKTLFQLPDGQSIEAVLMRYMRRRSICISSQAGCAMGCVFCATGQMGFRRHLSSGEIVEQVLYYARELDLIGDKVTNIVVMGMGEPFHNYTATLAAIDRLSHPKGMDLGERRFTISTVGLVPQIQRFAEEHRQINLAVSLHAVDDELRSSMLPVNRKYNIDELLLACRDYVEKTHRRITFEWALIRDVNDTPEQAHQLGKKLKGLLCHVNVIPLNPTQGYEGEATTRQRASVFSDILQSYGIPCTVRIRRGIDIQAGCGQLATEKGL